MKTFLKLVIPAAVAACLAVQPAVAHPDGKGYRDGRDSRYFDAGDYYRADYRDLRHRAEKAGKERRKAAREERKRHERIARERRKARAQWEREYYKRQRRHDDGRRYGYRDHSHVSGHHHGHRDDVNWSVAVEVAYGF